RPPRPPARSNAHKETGFPPAARREPQAEPAAPRRRLLHLDDRHPPTLDPCRRLGAGGLVGPDRADGAERRHVRHLLAADRAVRGARATVAADVLRPTPPPPAPPPPPPPPPPRPLPPPPPP